jgi:Ferritin-like domain
MLGPLRQGATWTFACTRGRAAARSARGISSGGLVVAADPSRRALLAVAAGLPLLVVGCRGTAALGTPPVPAPDVTVLRTAIAAEQAMITRYRAAIRLLRDGSAAGSANGPAADATLAALLTEHTEHLRQLRSRLTPGSPEAARPTLAPSPAPSVPATAQQAIRGLGPAEQDASDWLLGRVPEVPASLAQLMASICASEATHVPVLAALGPV